MLLIPRNFGLDGEGRPLLISKQKRIRLWVLFILLPWIPSSMLLFPTFYVIYTREPYSGTVRDYDKYKYDSSLKQVHVVNVDALAFTAVSNASSCYSTQPLSFPCLLLMTVDGETTFQVPTEGPHRRSRKPKPPLSDTERKYFCAMGGQGNWIDIIVHPIVCDNDEQDKREESETL